MRRPNIERRLPRPSEFGRLLRFRKVEWDATERRLNRALTIEDLRQIARRRTPRAPFEYADGAADAEISLDRARRTFENIEFHPSILRDVSFVDTTCDVLGSVSMLPFGMAPTGFTRMMQTEGEIGLARATRDAGIPFSLSTMGTSSIEAVAQGALGGRQWFQLYIWKDRARSAELIKRASAAGYDALLVTVDSPIPGRRLRDSRNGMTIPPSLTARTILDAIPRAGWWTDFLTTEPLEFANLDRWYGTAAELGAAMFDPSVTFDDLSWIRGLWPGKIVLKGVQGLSDARRAADAGMDAIVLSSHGGRQLDRSPVPFRILPTVVREVGSELEVWIDSGILSGADIVACIALGARFTLVGRALLYGLMAGGQRGAARAVAILQGEIESTMRLLGVASLNELTPAHVSEYGR